MAGLIVFEGIDGSGKSTHSKLFLEYLLQKNQKAVWQCEPTYGKIGTIIRDAFTGKISLAHTTIANLFAADRYEHIVDQQNGMLQLIQEGNWVICDRYLLSSYAYQGSLLDVNWVKEINKQNEEKLWPICTFYIDLDPEIAMQRIVDNREQVELFETNEQLKKVHAAYKKAINDLSASQQQSIKRIDGNQSINAIQETVQLHYENLLAKK